MLTKKTAEGQLEPVWDLSDKSYLADGIWFFAQAEVYERQVQFVAVKGDEVGGWAALDNIVVVESSPCEARDFYQKHCIQIW